MVGYLRHMLKKSFPVHLEAAGHDQAARDEITSKILLTRPMGLAYERYVFNTYLKVCEWLQENLNGSSTLEEDLELLKSGEPGNPNPLISFELRMAVVYRSEKKKILQS